MKISKTKINLLDYFVLNITTISLVGVFFLILNKFDPILSVIVGVLLALIFYRFFNLKIIKTRKQLPFFTVFILLVALIFRFEPYQYVLGGQDEGVYFNMAYYYKNYGSNFIKDNTLNLFKKTGLETEYIKNNFFTHREYLPGVYWYNKNNWDYVFQFYPLHPLWMSIFLGLTNHNIGVYALTMFSVFSILYSYLLTKEIFNNKYAGYLAAWFLTIHPVHAYFSKFPVTEVVALFFTLSSFYYLIKYYRAGTTNFFYLFLSFMLMTSFFFTRISGFMYLPFFYLLVLLTITYLKNNQKKQLLSYFGLIFGGYVLSVLYGLFYTPFYSRDIYYASFSKFFGNIWQKIILVSTFIFILFLIKLYFTPKLQKLFKKIVGFLGNKLYWLFYLVVTVSTYKAYTLAFTNKYVNSKWIHDRWKMDGLGLGSLHFSNLVVVINYLSPFLFLFLLVAVYLVGKKNDNLFLNSKTKLLFRLLLVFVILFWVFGTVVKFTTPYQYYYGRYLISELVPYTLIFVSGLMIMIIKKSSKHIQYLIFLLTFFASIFFLYPTVAQINKVVMSNTFSSLKQVVNNIDENDLIILDTDGNYSWWEIKTPLSFTFNRQVFNSSFNTICEQKKVINSLMNEHDIYLLSTSMLNKRGINIINKSTLPISRYIKTKYFPRNIHASKKTIYLYKISKEYCPLPNAL